MLNTRGLLLALLGIGLWLLHRWREQPAVPPHTRSAAPYEEMVRCTHCGVYLPRSRAIGNGRQAYFCTEEHRLAGNSNRP
ncbi:MAG: PP0621 family protein [Candidatus Competibacteraceae bacterium]